ncbi:phosphoethanolamine transferase [Acetobacter sp. LMG 32666]|uniref:phosphoethanolamine transferase n=1 Tax=Acetobacter sp. LMG 32666 TaxID=2959295 RepID=UPI0030C87D17
MLNLFKNKRFIIILIIGLSYSIMEFYIANHANGRHRALFTLEMSVIPLILFNLGRAFSAVFNTIFVLSLVFCWYIVYSCQYITDTNLDAIVGTNPHEALSMLETVPWFFYIVAAMLVIAVASVSWFLGKYNYRAMLIGLIPFVASLSYAGWKVYKVWPHYKLSWDEPATIGFFATQIRQQAPGIIGMDTYMGLIYFINTYTNTQFPVIPHAKTDPSVIKKHTGRVHNIIFIMGESSFAPRYSVYGYNKQKTTPYLLESQEKNQICVIEKAHSNANTTHYSVPMTFSFQTPDNSSNLLSEKNIIEMARDNGYKTFWIASQDGSGAYSRPFGYISEYSNYVTRQDYNNKYNGVNWKDESILPVLKEKFTDAAPYKMYVLHIEGSHMSYDDKYTKEDTQSLPNAEKYDLSIHHTDRLIQKIMSMASDTLGEYTLIYTSDHGEVVNKGHGLQFGGLDQYNIPMIIHDGNGNGYYCHMAESLRNDNGYYTSIMNKYLLLDMLGYDTNPQFIQKSKSIDTVLHSDSKMYNYNNIPTQNK